MTATSPNASAPCDPTPSKVSIANILPESERIRKAMANAATSTPIKTEMENPRDRATPRIAAWAVASPKYAIRRQTTKQPKGPDANATATPASAARHRKSSSIATTLLCVVVTMVMLVSVQRQRPFGIKTKQRLILRRSRDQGWRSLAAHMSVQADHMIR